MCSWIGESHCDEDESVRTALGSGRLVLVSGRVARWVDIIALFPSAREQQGRNFKRRKCRVAISRLTSHCHQQRTTLTEALPPPSDGTSYVWVQLERNGFTGCLSGSTLDRSSLLYKGVLPCDPSATKGR